MKISDETFALANKRGTQKQAHYPAAAAVKYDPGIARLVIDLASGLGLTIPLEAVQGLEDAVPADLADAEISPSGLGIYFPKLDTDIYLPALLEGVLGTKRWMAARNGKAGGKASTEAKAAAARENGKLGGRPKKKPDESPAG
jgi:hypothetical protein